MLGRNRPLAVTRARLALVTSLALTYGFLASPLTTLTRKRWWFAHLVSPYKAIVLAGISTQVQEARSRVPRVQLAWKYTSGPQQPYNMSKLALIIETRPLPHLVPQLLHMISVVPPDWRFLFIGSARSILSVSRATPIQHKSAIGKIAFLQLPTPWTIRSSEDIYRLLTDVRFYDEFLPGVEWILKYEYDSILCANSETDLNEWLDWNWAGSPRIENDRFSGHGGLSLRRVSAIKRILSFQQRHNNSEPEDEWFGKRLCVLPDGGEASRLGGALAMENTLVDRPMGYHIPAGGALLNNAIWKNPELRKEAFEYCPELGIIVDMKLERERCPDDNRDGTRGMTEEEDVPPAKEHVLLPPEPPLFPPTFDQSR